MDLSLATRWCIVSRGAAVFRVEIVLKMSVGKIGPFDVTKDTWKSYVERLEQYFIANDIKEAIKVATLITVIGSDAYELMVNLCTPGRPASKTFNELVAVMQNHLQPQASVLAERYKFRQRKQCRDETIADFVADLKRLSRTCNFSDLINNLRDQLVCGLYDDDIRQRLFAEEESTLSFEKACKIAVTMEAARTDAALVEGNGLGSGQPTSVYHNKVGAKRTWERKQRSSGRAAQAAPAEAGGTRTQARSGARWSRDATHAPRAGGCGVNVNNTNSSSKAFSSGEKCERCGGNHFAKACKFINYVCRICNVEGHLKRMCPRVRKEDSANYARQNYVENEVDSYPNSDGSEEVFIHSFSQSSENYKRYSPYYVTVRINGKIIKMELDTGSTISCISHDNYLKWFANSPIVKCNLLLRYYTGELVRPMGKIKVWVQFQNNCKSLDLFVIDKGKTTLFGRQWLYELGVTSPLIDCLALESKNDGFNLENFSSRFCEVFADGLGRFTGGPVTLRVRADARPVFMRARPIAYALREPVERALDQLVQEGVMTPVETSDWATPIVPVVKKDGTIRVCGDFKLTLNKCLEVDRFPLPKVEDLLAKLHGGKRFSKIDLSQAYAQFELDETCKFTVINTHKGLFRYNRLVYGLSSSPGIFQRKLEQLFGDIPRVGVFLDDVIITGEDDRQHLLYLNMVFERLRKYGLKIKKEKCTFFAKSVTYLGYVISQEGVHTCPDKIEAIKGAPVPKTVTELRSFLGLVMYYAKFVPNISTLLEPLYKLLKKNAKFQWNGECDEALNKVKFLLVSSEVLAHYSPDLPLVLTTDASSVGIGAVISHLMPGDATTGNTTKERPIAYASRSLNAAERGYAQIEKEALAIIYGVRKFHQYLYGRRFILRTDHKPLVCIFGEKTGIPVMAASRMQRWAVLLAGYDYEIEYVPTDKNGADALSRLPLEKSKCRKTEDHTYLNFVQNFVPITRLALKEATGSDNILRQIVLYLESGWAAKCSDEEVRPYWIRRAELYLDMGCVMWGYRLVVPTKLRELILKELHLGHLGIVKMKAVARSYVWWPGIDTDIERVCKECTTCIEESTAPPKAPVMPWPYLTEPWSRLHVDFLGPFHNKTFFVIIDSSTKWIEAFPMARTTASAVIKVLRETFARFGLPREVVSDNGPPFTSKEYAEFMQNNGIRLSYSAIYHPSSNGAAEGAVKLCKRAVKKSLRDGQDMEAALQTYLLAYRNVEHSTTGVSPATLLQKRNLRSRLDAIKGDRIVEDRVRSRQKRQVESAGGIPREFRKGDRVWMRNYTGGRNWCNGKIEEKLGSRNYMVVGEDGSHFKRHIDQIKSRSMAMFEWPGPDPESDKPIVQAETADGSGAHGSKVVSLNTDSTSPEGRSRRVRRPVKRFGIDID